jgi:hypothetical protein
MMLPSQPPHRNPQVMGLAGFDPGTVPYIPPKKRCSTCVDVGCEQSPPPCQRPEDSVLTRLCSPDCPNGRLCSTKVSPLVWKEFVEEMCLNLCRRREGAAQPRNPHVVAAEELHETKPLPLTEKEFFVR